MSDLVRYTNRGLARSEAKAVGRALARMEAETHLEVARIQQIANLDAQRVAGIIFVTDVAMTGVTVLTDKQEHLAEGRPNVEDRLSWLVDGATVACRQILDGTGRRMGQR